MRQKIEEWSSDISAKGGLFSQSAQDMVDQATAGPFSQSTCHSDYLIWRYGVHKKLDLGCEPSLQDKLLQLWDVWTNPGTSKNQIHLF